MDMEQITFSIYRQNVEPNATIKVNGEEVAVNKCILAISSAYFDRHFFDDRYPPAENIELPPLTRVEDFKRLVATLPPEQRPLDDDCLESVLILADRFAMDNVLDMCRGFLIASNKPKLFKFRIAHKYGWTALEELILQSMRVDDHVKNFVENAAEFAKMDDDARAAFSVRHAKIVPGISNSVVTVPSHNQAAAVRRARWYVLDDDDFL